MGEHKRKTVEKRFEDWWKRNGYLHHLPPTVDDLRRLMRCAYHNGWSARTRTKR